MLALAYNAISMSRIGWTDKVDGGEICDSVGHQFRRWRAIPVVNELISMPLHLSVGLYAYILETPQSQLLELQRTSDKHVLNEQACGWTYTLIVTAFWTIFSVQLGFKLLARRQVLDFSHELFSERHEGGLVGMNWIRVCCHLGRVLEDE